MSIQFPIVGIGASAGGLEALQSFVQAIPQETGLAFVVVQHLAPDHPSIMDQLLTAHSTVPVQKIEHEQPIRPDTISIIPPGPFLEIADGRFKLVDHAREQGIRTPIDRFFTSLAEGIGRNAYAVVLSGTGSDGTLGIRAVKAAGGTTFAQESGSARFPGMPDSAAATGLVDFIMRPSDMPNRILDIRDYRQQLETGVAVRQIEDDIAERLDEILVTLAEDGEDGFKDYKQPTLVRRIRRRLSLLRQSSIDRYIERLKTDRDERRALAQDFLIGVTEFFRDPEIAEVVRSDAIRTIVASEAESLRFWVPGCSTGEEAFSLAIQVFEEMEAQDRRRPVQVFGTDIDMNALRHARAAVFTNTALSNVSEDRLGRFFVSEGGAYKVIPAIRELCVFAPHNLLTDPPFSKLDLVSCRNVMIYLSKDAQKTLMPRFHYGLKPGGFLVLGPSETLGMHDDLFDPVDRQARLFKRNNRAHPGYSLLNAMTGRPRPANTRNPEAASVTDADLRQAMPLQQRIEQAFLRTQAAPFAVVDRHGRLVHLSEAMTDFVKPTSGAPDTTTENFLSQELRLPVQAAVSECRSNDAPSEIKNVVTDIDGTKRLFDVVAMPLADEENLVLIVLHEVRLREGQEIAPETQKAASTELVQRELTLATRRLELMESEFDSSKQEAQSANEELLSMNEELQSANEELETSREELQSINEELETINAELSENNRQLARANSDLKNVFESNDIATLFLDAELRVRLFTPPLEALYGVRDRDIGRDIADLAARVDYPDLAQDARSVMQTLQTVEREVRVPVTEQTFLVRLRPYRTIDERLDGCVVSFIDVTEIKRNEGQLEENARTLRQQYAELETLYDSTPVGLSLMDRNLRWMRINQELADINGFPIEDHIGKKQEDLIPDIDGKIRDVMRHVLNSGEAVLGIEVEGETPQQPGVTRHWVVDYYPVKDGDTTFAVGTCVHEVTEQVELQKAVAANAAVATESEARMARLFDQAPAIISIFEGPEHRYLYVNSLHDAATGKTDLIGKPLRDAMPELEGQGIIERFEKVYETGEPLLTGELAAQIGGEGGETTYYQQIIQPWYGEDGAVGGTMSFNYDVTELVKAREDLRSVSNRLSSIQDSLIAFVGLLAPDGTVLEANAYALEGAGLTRDDVVGRKFWDCYWWNYAPEMQDRMKAWVARAAKGEYIREECDVQVENGHRVTIDFQLVPDFDEIGNVVEIVPSGIDITGWKAAEARKDTLLAELQHRVKNALATVQAVTRFTARHSDTKEDLVKSLSQRLAAISRTHDSLTRTDWVGQSLRDIVTAEVAPYVGDGSAELRFEGSNVVVDPHNALSLSLAFHELATNAAKYGALSTEGTVTVTIEAKGNALSSVVWQEAGGPPVAEPSGTGFGSFLLTRILPEDLDATVELTYYKGGVSCRIDLEADH
ncbi:MAG: chemotaxis protein CheB [Paracoccaceae bacterium]